MKSYLFTQHKIIILKLLTILNVLSKSIAWFWQLWSCAGNKSKKCKVCDGTGYYEKKTCVFCDGTGESDIKPYKEVYGD